MNSQDRRTAGSGEQLDRRTMRSVYPQQACLRRLSLIDADCNSKNCQQTTLFKAAFMKYSCCMLKSRQQPQHKQQQTACANRTIAQGAKAADQTLVPCGITTTAIDLRSPQFHYRSLALKSLKQHNEVCNGSIYLFLR